VRGLGQAFQERHFREQEAHVGSEAWHRVSRGFVRIVRSSVRRPRVPRNAGAASDRSWIRGYIEMQHMPRHATPLPFDEGPGARAVAMQADGSVETTLGGERVQLLPEHALHWPHAAAGRVPALDATFVFRSASRARDLAGPRQSRREPKDPPSSTG
jgi:hypothetical protein